MQVIDPKGSFLKNLVLSLLLLGVTSLLIPIVLKQIDDRRTDDQQRLQADLSRQDKIIDAQAALLDDFASKFWDYVGYASDVVGSRDERTGQDAWHQRAVAAYYAQATPLLAQMRADISTLARLAPRPVYESFLQLFDQEVLPFDACLLELLSIEAAALGTPQPAGGTALPASGTPQPTGCTADGGKFAGASWDTLTAYVGQDLPVQVDQAFEGLAEAFGLHDALD